MLTEQQKEAVRKWVGEGRGVSEIQKLISSEFGIDMLYMDVRFLIDDIGAEIPAAGDSPVPDAQQPAMAADSSGLGDSAGVQDDVSAGEPHTAPRHRHERRCRIFRRRQG